MRRKQTVCENQLEWEAFKPSVYFTPVMIPQGDGSFLVKPGKLQVAGDEVSTREFARMSGLSQRRVQELCDEGRLNHRRPGGPQGKIFIPKSELEKALKYQQ